MKQHRCFWCASECAPSSGVLFGGLGATCQWELRMLCSTACAKKVSVMPEQTRQQLETRYDIMERRLFEARVAMRHQAQTNGDLKRQIKDLELQAERRDRQIEELETNPAGFARALAVAILIAAAVATLVLGLALPASAQTGADDICISFEGLRLLDEKGSDASPLQSFDVPAGEYMLTLASADLTHIDAVDPTQTVEQWNLWTGDGRSFGPSADIADKDVMSSVTVAVVLQRPISEVRAIHVGGTGNVNSVDPVSACFAPVAAPVVTSTTSTSTIPPTTAAPDTTASSTVAPETLPVVPVDNSPTTTTTLAGDTTVDDERLPNELAITGPKDVLKWAAFALFLGVCFVSGGRLYDRSNRSS